MSLKPQEHSIAWDRFTDAQRRRAEALLLTHLLFPLAPPEMTRALAEWVVRGSRRPQVRGEQP